MAVIAGEFAQMVTTALSQKEVAELLGVSTSRIRQKLEAGELYAVRTTGGRVCPRFQFGPGGTLPGLESVLRALRPEAHPVAVQRFFMEVHPDLESEALNRALSPHEWLLTGHSPEALVVPGPRGLMAKFPRTAGRGGPAGHPACAASLAARHYDGPAVLRGR